MLPFWRVLQNGIDTFSVPSKSFTNPGLSKLKKEGVILADAAGFFKCEYN